MKYRPLALVVLFTFAIMYLVGRLDGAAFLAKPPSDGWTVAGKHLVLGQRDWAVGLPKPAIIQRNLGGRWQAFSIDDSEWLVAFEHGGRLETLQRVEKAHQHAIDADINGVRLGDSVQAVIARLGRPSRNELFELRFKRSGAPDTFVGLDRNRRVYRFGITLGDAELPPYIRWYQSSGRDESGAVPLGAADRDTSDKTELARMNELGCDGNEKRRILRRTTSGLVEHLDTQCGQNGFREQLYFNVAMRQAALSAAAHAASSIATSGVEVAQAQPARIQEPPARLPSLPTLQLPPEALRGHRARPNKLMAPQPRATPVDRSLRFRHGRVRGSAHLPLSRPPISAAATPLPIVITGYSESPNGRRYRPETELFVQEFQYNQALSPTSFQMWIVGPGDANLQATKCANFAVTDVFSNQYRGMPFPRPQPLPTPQPFPTIAPFYAARGSAKSSTQIRKTAVARPFQLQTLSLSGVGAAARRHTHSRLIYDATAFGDVDPTAVHSVLAANCPFGGSGAQKCVPDSTAGFDATTSTECPPSGSTCVIPGSAEVVMVMYVGNTAYLSPPVQYQTADDPRNFEHSGLSASSNSGTVDPVSGTLFERHTDFALSGPGGLTFTRWYDSRNATFSHAGMGNGWRHSYSDYLDLSAKCSARITYVDDEGNREYFSAIVPGHTAYDQQTGNSITWNADDSYSLTTWDNDLYQFDNAGRMQSKSDRHGNTSTLTYTGAGVQSVTDALGRVLTFAYDGNNMLSSVAVNGGPNVTFTYGCSSSLCTVKEPDGGVWKYQYSLFNYGSYLTLGTDPNGKTSETNTYQTVNLPYKQAGDPTTPSYRIATQTTGNGKNALAFAYAAGANNGLDDGFVTTTVSDSLGRNSTFTWSNGLQQITDIVGPLCNCEGGERHNTFDGFGRVSSMSDGGGLTFNYTYGQDIASVGTYYGGQTYTQTAIPNVTLISDLGYQYGRTKSIGYGASGTMLQDRPATITEPSYASGKTKTTAIQYNPVGDATQQSVTGQTGSGTVTYTSGYSFDSRGRLLSATGPRTDVTELTTYKYYSDSDSDFARRGQLNSVTDALGHVTQFGVGNPSYDYFGNPLSSLDANGVQETFTYDSAGRPLSSKINPSGVYTTTISASLTRDAMGQPKVAYGPNGNRMAYSRDLTEHLISEIAEDSTGLQRQQMSLGFDTMSEPTSTAMQSCQTPSTSCSSWVTAKTQGYAFDSHARLAKITNGPAGTAMDGTLLTYNDPPSNAVGELGSIVSGTFADLSAGADNTVLGHAYDYSNTRLVNQDIYVTGGTAASGFRYGWNQTFTYDILNQMTSSVGRIGPPSSLVRDDWGRMISRSSQVYGNETFTYDGDSNLKTSLDAYGNATSYAYDALNRALKETANRAGAPTETVAWAYDDPTAGNFGIGRLATMTDPSGSQKYTYERRGLLASASETIAGKGTYLTKHGYDSDGNETALTYPSGRVVAYAFDYLDRPTSVTSGSKSYVSAVSYAPFGPRTSLTFGNGSSETYTLDQNYLIGGLKVSDATGSPLVDRTYLRDGQHRITSIVDNLAAGYSQTFGYNSFQLGSANSGTSLWGTDTVASDPHYYVVNYQQFSSYHGASHYVGTVNSDNPWKPAQTYVDGSEHPISYDVHSNASFYSPYGPYSYSARDELTSADGIAFAYDGSGRRVSAKSSVGSRGYVYGPDRSLLSETDSSTTAPAYDYVYLDGQPIAQEDVAGSTHWTASDHLGTPFLQTDSAAKPYWFADYEPFGSVYALRTSDAHQPLRRPGQEATLISGTSGPAGDTSLLYNGFRWYSPMFAQYTQPDPSGLASSLNNPYGYTENDPVNRTDATGLKVTLSTHPIGFPGGIPGSVPFGHAYLVLHPDHLKDFINDRRFNPSCSADPAYMNSTVTISGEPSADSNMLEGSPDADMASVRQNATEISRGDDTAFIKDLAGYDHFYVTHPLNEEGYDGLTLFDPNSNSYIGSLLAKVGARISNPRFLALTMVRNIDTFVLPPYLLGWDRKLSPNSFSGKSVNLCPRLSDLPPLFPSYLYAVPALTGSVNATDDFSVDGGGNAASAPDPASGGH